MPSPTKTISSPRSSKGSKSSKSSTAGDSHLTRSTRSRESYDSHSTNATSIYSSARPSQARSTAKAFQQQPPQQQQYAAETPGPMPRLYEADLSYGTRTLHPRASVETYASTNPSQVDLAADQAGCYYDQEQIPPLPCFQPEYTEQPGVMPSSPKLFSRLFPSMNRLSIQHDDTSPDGNMNLRVDTQAKVSGHWYSPVQLFHLRMHDLTSRVFSLRRYCRDSGREVCNSKRKYTSAPAAPASNSTPKKRSSKRLGIFSPTTSPGDQTDRHNKHGVVMEPTNTIKLDFSNYARVDLERHGSSSKKRYDFSWWNHSYSWVRTTHKHTGAVSFHLMRGKESEPVAHIVPDSRTPAQQMADEQRGGWVPPCHMWISDQALVDAQTDVSDVVVASGLLALVDDCIKERWEKTATKSRHISVPVPLTSRVVDVEIVKFKTFWQRLFGGGGKDRSSRRRNSESSDSSHHTTSSNTQSSSSRSSPTSSPTKDTRSRHRHQKQQSHQTSEPQPSSHRSNPLRREKTRDRYAEPEWGRYR